MKIITKRPNGTTRVITQNNEPSLTQQQFHDASDINQIMKKYHATGMITHLNQKKGAYLDLSSAKDYQQSLDLVIEAQRSFMTLPSETRARFQNDPQQLISFLSDDKNREEAIKLKLINPKIQTPTPPSHDNQTPPTPPPSPKP